MKSQGGNEIATKVASKHVENNGRCAVSYCLVKSFQTPVSWQTEHDVLVEAKFCPNSTQKAFWKIAPAGHPN